MTIKSVSLYDESTEQQRREFVTNFLNLELTGTENDSQITAKIEAAQPGIKTIFVNEPDSPEEGAAQETVGEVPLRTEEVVGKQSGTLGKGDPRARIFIPIVDTEDESGARDVLVGVNGRAWQLKRGEDLDVPWRVVVALQNSIADVVRHSQQPDTLGDVTVSKAHRFNFNFVSRPSEAEIAEWDKRVGSQFCA